MPPRARRPDIRDALEQMMKFPDIVRESMQAKTQERKELRATCSFCGKQEGKALQKLSFCSICKSATYCSKEHQANHWKSHKADCRGFASAPTALCFDTRPMASNVDGGPMDPVFAKYTSTDDGIGVWISRNTSDLYDSMQYAWQPPNVRYDTVLYPEASPEFHTWAGDEKRDVSRMKVFGHILLPLKILVQNRRQDKGTITVNGSSFGLLCSSLLENMQDDRDKKHLIWIDVPQDGKQKVLFLRPWIDYKDEQRIAITEINRTRIPLASYHTVNLGNIMTQSRVYDPTPRPKQGVWAKVVHWGKNTVQLSPGDFAVFEVQFRAGDGHKVALAPSVLVQLGSMIIKAKIDGAGANGDSSKELLLNVPFDQEYIEEYFKVFFEEGVDEHAESKHSHAAAANKAILSTAPAHFRMLMDQLTPQQREKAVDSMRMMGAPIDRFMAEAYEED